MKFNLSGTPRPHYLETVEELSPDGYLLRGTVLFPSSDVTIGDRGHVNAAHHLLAGWNAAHMMCRQHGLRRPLALHTEVTSIRLTLPDKPVNIEATALIESSNGRRVKGLLTVEFSRSGKPLCRIITQFRAQRI